MKKTTVENGKVVKRLAKLKRKIDGNGYHLVIHTFGYADGIADNDWYLFKKDVNNPIMEGSKNTIEELETFVKKHYRISATRGLILLDLVIACLLFILTIVNIFFINSSTIRGFVYGGEFIIFSNTFLINAISNRNFKVDILEFKESLEESKTQLDILGK